MNVEMKQVSVDKLEDLAKDSPEIQKFLEGFGGIPALRKINKPHKYQRVSSKQVAALNRCK